MNRKQEEATSRNVARKKRSPEDQLAVLNSRLGTGSGAAKERKRLEEQIAKRLEEEDKKGDGETPPPRKSPSQKRKRKRGHK